MVVNDTDGERRGGSLSAKAFRAITLFVLLPVILLMNACSLVIEEKRDAASSGFLTAKVILLNGGAMSDYNGAVWVLPRYFPRVWPLDLLVGCRALMFESDPRIDLVWEGSTLVIEHDPFAYPVSRQSRCYGRAAQFKERNT